MATINDWMIAGLNNPDFTVEDFEMAGLDVKNTVMLSKDEYKESPYIKKYFDKDGTFDEKAFDEYYNKRLGEFAYFSQDDKFQYDLYDTSRKPTSRTKNPNFSLYAVPNPDRITYGIASRNEFGKRKYGRTELAETQQIYNPETNEYTEETVNDFSLSNSFAKWIDFLIDEPLVLAQYDEDGEHYDQYYGQMIQHKKGDYKLNKNGTYYTERLNGRSPSGKTVIKASDILSIDGEGWNKYDFFDSDDIDKNVHGIIYKNAVSLLPLLWGPAAAIYGGLLTTREIAKSLPMLYGIVNSYFGDGEDSKIINDIAAYGEKFTSGTSEYGQEHMISLENAANLITDVCTQWASQKFIAKGIGKLIPQTKAVDNAYKKAFTLYNMQKLGMESKVAAGQMNRSTVEQLLGTVEKWDQSSIGKAAIKQFVPKAEKVAKRANRIAGDASLLYMSIISNTDVYESMLEHGASKKEAAVFSLASMLGMFAVDRWTGLGEIFLNNLGDNVDRSIRATFKKSVPQIYKDTIEEIAKNPVKNQNKLRTFFQSGLKFGKNVTNEYLDDLKYHSASFLGKAFGEGLEEVGEEVVTDLVKSLYEGLGELNLVSVKDVGAWDNALARYGMNFAGGFIGGGIFGATEMIQGNSFHRDTTQDEFINLVANGYKDRVLNELEKQHKSGKLGSTSLSMRYETDKDGNRVYLSKQGNEDSQNDFVYKRIKESIYQLDNIINENQMNLSDEDLFLQMVLSDVRFTKLKQWLDTENLGYISGYTKKFRKLTSDIIDIEQSLSRASKTKEGVDPGILTDENTITDEQFRHLSKEDAQRRENNLNILREKKAKLIEERDKFLDGEYSLPYTEKMLFAIDSNLNNSFVKMNYEQWLLEKYNKTMDQLTDAESIEYKQQYLDYKRNAQEKDLDIQFEIYKNIKKLIDPILLEFSENESSFDKNSKKLGELFGPNSPLANLKLYQFDDLLDGETEESESYVSRNDSPDNIEQRENIIQKINNDALTKLRDEIISVIEESGGFIDPVTRRRLQISLKNRNKDLIEMLKEDLDMSNDEKQILSGLNSDFSNIDEIKQKIEQLHIQKNTQRGKSLSLVYNDLYEQTIYYSSDKDYILDNIDKLKNAYKNKTGKELSNEDAANLLFSVMSTPISAIRSGEFTEDSIQQLEDGTYYLTQNPIIENLYNYDDYDNYQISVLQNVLSRMKEAFLSEDYSTFEITPIDDVQEWINDNPEISKDIDYAKQKVDEYVNSIKSNSLIDLNNELNKRIKELNPIKNLIKSLAVKLGKNSTELSSLLDKLSEQYESIDSVGDFTLTDDEMSILDEAEDLIEKAKAYLYAASIKSGNMNANGSVIEVGHNKALNEFVKANKKIYPDFELLPTISHNLANTLENELNHYLLEIGIINPETKEYNPGSWRQLHQKNAINKEEQFKRAEKAFNDTLLNFIETIRDSLKFVIENKEYDLLEGYESVGKNLNKIQHLLYVNYKKLEEKGITLEKILNSTNLLEQITNISKVPHQITSKLNENLKTFTDYDKVIVFGTLLSLDINEWNKFVKLRVEAETDIAPLTIQEWNSRVACAYINNSSIFNVLINKCKQLNPEFNLPSIEGVFINGVAGAGKSRVVAKNAVEFLSKDSNVWLCAPTESQLKTLFKSTGKGITKTLDGDDSLFSTICDVSSLNTALKNFENQDNDSEFYEINDINGNSIYKINKDKFGIKKLDDAPKLLVIDEATYINNIKLQVLSEFAKLNNCKLLLLGHDKQNGDGYNLRREACYIIRTPEMAVSLRDNNEQHQSDLRKVEDLMDNLSDSDTTESNVILPIIKTSISRLNFRAYVNGEVNGDLIVDSIDGVPIKIDPDEEGKRIIGYVGNNNSTISKLREQGLEVVVMSKKQIQGQEFPYVVIETDWNLPEDASVFQTYNFLQDLYTMMSRSQIASIFVSSQLPNIIGQNKIDNVKAMAPSFKNSIKTFIDHRKEQLKDISTESDKKEEAKTNNKEQKENKNKVNITNISKKDKLKINTDTKEGIYSFDWLPKHNGKIIGMQVKFNGNDVLLDIGYIDDDKIKVLPNDSRAWDFLSIKDFKPEQIIYNLKTQEIIAKNSDDSKTLKSNPYEDLLEIETIKESPNEDESSVMFENPVEIPTFSKEIQDQDKGDAEEDIPSYDDEILCFGSGAITGYQVEIKDGLEVWKRPDLSKTDYLRDLQILTDDEVINPGDKQIDLSVKLKTLRNSWLYSKEYRDLPEFIKKLVTSQQYKKTKYYVEIREKTKTDNFIRNLGLDNSQITIGKYVYSVVAEFKNRDGKVCRVTLGLLGSPSNFLEKIPSIEKRLSKKIEKLQKRLNNGEDVKDIITKLQNKKDGLSTQAENYEKLIQDLEANGPQNIEINKPDFTGMTYLRKITSKGNKVPRLRLYSYTKAQIKAIEDSLENKRDSYIQIARKEIQKLSENIDKSFLALNPYTVVSDVYVYTPSSESEIPGVDESIKGSAVVFVSNDDSLTPEELVKEYLDQKNNVSKGLESQGRVRMIVLNNTGVQFSDLTSPWHRELMQISNTFKSSSGEDIIIKNITPFENDYMGARMYVSLWNFRANLLEFCNKLSKLEVDFDELEKYAIVSDLVYKRDELKEELTSDEKSIVSSESDENYSKYKQIINQFNSQLNGTLKQFRLGGGYKNGFYIRQIVKDKSLSPLYGDVIPNGIYITPSKAKQMLELIESLFANTLDKVIQVNGIEKNHLLTTKNGAVNSLSRNYTKVLTDGNLVLSDGKTQIQFSSPKDSLRFSFSNIPAILLKTSKYLGMLQAYPDATHPSISIIKNKEVVERIPYYNIYNEVLVHRNIDNTDLDDLFDLCFHGTTNDISNTDVLRCSDAFFPNGLYVDPMCSMDVKTYNNKVVFKKCIINPIFFTTDVMVDDPIFYIRLQPVKSKQKSEKEKVKEFSNPYSEICSQLGIEIPEDADITKEDIEESINNIIESNKKSLFENSDLINGIKPYAFTDGKLISFQDYFTNYFRETEKKELGKINSITLNKNEIKLETDNYNIIISKGTMNKNFKYKITAKNLNTVSDTVIKMLSSFPYEKLTASNVKVRKKLQENIKQIINEVIQELQTNGVNDDVINKLKQLQENNSIKSNLDVKIELDHIIKELINIPSC